MTIENFGPLIIAVLVFSVMVVITIIAMKKYQFNQVLELWKAQAAVFGVMIGAMTAHFFGVDARNQAVALRDQAVSERNQAVEAYAMAKENLDKISTERDRALNELTVVSAEHDQALDNNKKFANEFRASMQKVGDPILSEFMKAELTRVMEKHGMAYFENDKLQ